MLLFVHLVLHVRGKDVCWLFVKSSLLILHFYCSNVTSQQLDLITSDYHSFVANIFIEAQIPRSRILTHGGFVPGSIYCFFFRKVSYSHTHTHTHTRAHTHTHMAGYQFGVPSHTQTVWNSPIGAITPHAQPGWSMYNVSNASSFGLDAALDVMNGTHWGSPG
jgi:hypothetical protein